MDCEKPGPLSGPLGVKKMSLSMPLENGAGGRRIVGDAPARMKGKTCTLKIGRCGTRQSPALAKTSRTSKSKRSFFRIAEVCHSPVDLYYGITRANGELALAPSGHGRHALARHNADAIHNSIVEANEP